MYDVIKIPIFTLVKAFILLVGLHIGLALLAKHYDKELVKTPNDENIITKYKYSTLVLKLYPMMAVIGVVLWLYSY